MPYAARVKCAALRVEAERGSQAEGIGDRPWGINESCVQTDHRGFLDGVKTVLDGSGSGP